MKNILFLMILIINMSSCAHVTQKIDIEKGKNIDNTTQTDIKQMHYGPIPNGRF